jgi:hypothetical protein
MAAGDAAVDVFVAQILQFKDTLAQKAKPSGQAAAAQQIAALLRRSRRRRQGGVRVVR